MRRWTFRSRCWLGLGLAALFGAAVEAAQQPVTVSLLWWVSEDGTAGSKAEVDIIRRFEQLNPDIKVERLAADWGGITDKFKTMAAAGSPPDVLWVRETHYYDLAVDGFLTDLSAFIQKDRSFDVRNFLPGVMESAQVNKRQYALHRDVWAPVIFYNVDQWESAGLERPKQGWTFDDVLLAAKRLTDPVQKRFGMGNIQTAREGMVYAHGGRWMNEAGTAFTLLEDNALRAIQLMRDFVWVHGVQPKPGDLPDWWEPQWTRGQVAMQFWGPWAWPTYQQTLNFQWDIAPLPRGPAGAFAKLDGLMLALPKGAKNPDAAWRLLKFLAYEEQAQTLQVLLGVAGPTVRYPDTLQAFSRSAARPKSVEHYVDALNRGVIGLPRVPSRVYEIIDQAFNDIMNNTKDPKSALTEAQRQAEAILREYSSRR